MMAGLEHWKEATSTTSIFLDHLGLVATWSPKEDPLEGVGGGVGQARVGGHQPGR